MSKPMSEQMQKVADRYEKATGKKFNQKTNADHIRSMTDEELAQFLDDTQYREWEEIQGNRRERLEFESCVDGWTAWLKQPYKEGT